MIRPIRCYFVLFLLLSLSRAGAQSFELSELVVQESVGANRSFQIEPKMLNAYGSRSLMSALEQQTGIDTQISCAFCGSRRLSINGQRGEHTTILIDGLSLHSTISSFYGVDAIPLTGVSSIDVYRGASSTFTLPESLAGAISIQTQAVEYTESQAWFSTNQRAEPSLTLQHKQRINSEWGVLLSAQGNDFKAWDVDQNKIAESPAQKTFTTLNKVQWRPSLNSDIQLRLSHGEVRTRGGHLLANEILRPTGTLANSTDFTNQDIRNEFIGDPNKIRDQVNLQRTEIALSSNFRLENQHKFILALGAATQSLAAIYAHGFDYQNRDNIINIRTEYSLNLTNNWLLSLGMDTKEQKMNSTSEVLFGRLALPSDRLNHSAHGLFAQAQWLPVDQPIEVSLSLRMNDLRTYWADLNKRVNGQLSNPKIAVKFMQTDQITHITSLGLGYRAPLSLFESQHGTDHYGFLVNLDKIESSQNANYSFIFQSESDYVETGLSWNRILNMAYGLDRAITSSPTLFLNSDQIYDLVTFDTQWAHKLSERIDFEVRFEHFHMPLAYKQKLPVASIEERIQVKYQLKFHKKSLQFLGNWIGSRDLAQFAQYSRHFNRVVPINDPLNPNFGDPPRGIDQKNQIAPHFWTFDLHFNQTLTDELEFNFSILNIFDFTQAGVGDGPLTWHLHGQHYHLDNFHIWGPLRGREFVARIKYTF